MIRHIVLFKFKAETGDGQRKEFAKALKRLKKQIPFIKELEVGFDVAGKPNSYDIALNSVFETLDDVEEYAVHPDHVKVVEMVKTLCESSVKVDCEI